MTTPLENEINALKKELVSMWILVQSQLNKAKEAMVQFDKDLAREVLIKEKRVNSYELKIDRDCENIFALHCPVAIDLRFLLGAKNKHQPRTYWRHCCGCCPACGRVDGEF